MKREKPIKEASRRGWTVDESEYERSRSPAIIKQALEMLKREGILVYLAYSGYQSGGTVLLDCNLQRLTIGKPPDWPGKSNSVRIDYKDRKRLWNHFHVTLIQVSADTLEATIPKEIFRLQRRRHFRIDAPPGSLATFLHRGRKYEGFFVHNVSAGGMLAGTKSKPVFVAGDAITNLSLLLVSPSNAEARQELLPLALTRGAIVHSHRDVEQGVSFFGIRFENKAKEEDKLIRYVRQLEIELLRQHNPLLGSSRGVRDSAAESPG